MYISRRGDTVGPPVWKSTILHIFLKSECQQHTLRPPHCHMLTPTGYLTVLFHTQYPSDIEHDIMADLECIQAELKENIAQAQERYQKNADKHRAEPPKLEVTNQAYVKVKFFRPRQPSKKLSEKNLGPFDIIGKPGTHPVTL